MAEHNEIGKIGENVTTTFLMKHGFSVLERNYRIKYGEIDIADHLKVC
jgi:putative endonuclease